MPLGAMLIFTIFMAFLGGLELGSPGVTGDVVKAFVLVEYAVKNDLAHKLCLATVAHGNTTLTCQ
jgi:hypothetical protein